MVTQNQSKVPEGTLLEGKFRVTREIGRGGMAAVYEAENIDIGKRVAVKILAAELITSRIVRERFLREARAAAAVRSPHICDVYDSGMYQERPFLVMELLEGESLYDLLTRSRQLDVETTLRVAGHSARGLQRAHEANVVHRDLKPENIFLTKDEEGKLLAKLVDFGLAKFYEPTVGDQATVRLTREGALFGTPAYMSPEQAKGKGEVDSRADLWALGCIVYECLTGQTVWNVDQGVAMILAQIASAPLPKPSKLRPDLPPGFDAWFLKALDRDPDRRFQTARELAQELTRALAFAAASPRSLSLSSDHEGLVVDELMASSDRSPGPVARDNALPLTVPAPPGQLATAPGRPANTSQHGVRPGLALSLLMFAALVCLGGYAAWLYVLHPPDPKANGQTPSAPSAATPVFPAKRAGIKPRSSTPSAAEAEGYAAALASAQGALASGQLGAAVEQFKTAFQESGSPAARSLMSHASVAVEEGGGGCKVTGLGRPRPYEITEPASRPAIALGESGALFAWIDNHADPKRRQASAVLLDSALRRISPAIAVTPEATSLRTVAVQAMSGGLALSYWDDGGEEPGVYVRRLSSDGKIAGPARRLSSVKRGELVPTLASAPDGTFYGIWEEDAARSRVELWARKLDSKLEPLAPAVRLAEFASAARTANTATSPDAVVAHGALALVFAVDRGAERREIMFLRVPLGDAALATGLAPDKQRKAPQDRHVGLLTRLSGAPAKATAPRMTCTKEACLAVWDDEKGGASASFIEKDKTEPLWHREFAPKGSRPTLAASDEVAFAAWFEESRLRFATLGRDGLGPSSVLTRVNGIQPQPEVAPADKPGSWLIAWRGYESARFEAFALRTECQ